MILITSRIEGKEDRIQDAVALVTSCLVGRGSIKSPVWEISQPKFLRASAVFKNFGLASKLLSWLGSIDPDVFCYYIHLLLQRIRDIHLAAESWNLELICEVVGLGLLSIKIPVSVSLLMNDL